MAGIDIVDRRMSPADIAQARRYGRRAIFLAGMGLLLLCALSVLTAAMPGIISDQSGVTGARLLAPILNLTGAGFAIAGLIRSPAKIAPGLGLLLNLLILSANGQIVSALGA
ncbi:MAG: hypothetical protein KF849_02105 [Rhizobiaceae bacterium]|nr:hypothetical protein [Rhizobiaceae bacterium]